MKNRTRPRETEAALAAAFLHKQSVGFVPHLGHSQSTQAMTAVQTKNEFAAIARTAALTRRSPGTMRALAR